MHGLRLRYPSLTDKSMKLLMWLLKRPKEYTLWYLVSYYLVLDLAFKHLKGEGVSPPVGDYTIQQFC